MEDLIYQCPNGCLKYRKTMDEIIIAGQKHKEILTAIKVIADDQKRIISKLREDKYKLQEEVDEFESKAQIDHEIIAKVKNRRKSYMKRKKKTEKTIASYFLK